MSNYHIISGTHMEAGYRAGQGSLIIGRDRDGRIFEWSTSHRGEAPYGWLDTRNSPLVLDADGQITRDGAEAGWGFLASGQEIERLAKIGIVFAAAHSADQNKKVAS